VRRSIQEKERRLCAASGTLRLLRATVARAHLSVPTTAQASTAEAHGRVSRPARLNQSGSSSPSHRTGVHDCPPTRTSGPRREPPRPAPSQQRAMRTLSLAFCTTASRSESESGRAVGCGSRGWPLRYFTTESMLRPTKTRAVHAKFRVAWTARARPDGPVGRRSVKAPPGRLGFSTSTCPLSRLTPGVSYV
jgi:hypothetical protein